MSFKAIFRLVVFLATVFVVIYVAVNNRQSADFNFPILQDKKTTTDAWEIYFGMFAVGVFVGALLMVGSGRGKARAAGKAEK